MQTQRKKVKQVKISPIERREKCVRQPTTRVKRASQHNNSEKRRQIRIKYMAHNNTTQKHFKPIIIISWLWVVGWWRSTLVKFEKKTRRKRKTIVFVRWALFGVAGKRSAHHSKYPRDFDSWEVKNRVEFKLESFCIARETKRFDRVLERHSAPQELCGDVKVNCVSFAPIDESTNWNSRRLNT